MLGPSPRVVRGCPPAPILLPGQGRTPVRIPGLTIVVNAHERHWTLERCLRYYKDFEGPVIITDSSRRPYARIHEYPWVDYRHQPEMIVYEKLKEILASVQTEFAVLIPD